jgi:glyoxylase-like metal-dependent hydrolase (beta-lactamase superfamily II)
MRYVINKVTAFRQNATLIWCEQTGQAAVVDPGGGLDRIQDSIVREGVTLCKIILTHGHIDHAGFARELAESHQVPIEGPHRADAFLLENLAKHAEQTGLPHSGVFVPDRWLQEGDVVYVGELRLEVLHCPGHTPGHVAFYLPEHRFALVGDVLFRRAIGRSDFARSNPEHLLQSIREKLLPLGDDITFIPGHGAMSTFGEERVGNPHLR